MPNAGDILAIDLTAQSIDCHPTPPAMVEHLLLGRGYNAMTLLRMLAADVQPLDPENVLLFSCGLLTGTAAPTAARVHVGARSPLTGLLGSSSVGGRVGHALRRNGIQVLQLVGRAAIPSYLFISPAGVELRDATHLWGLDVEESTRQLAEDQRDEGLVMFLIGPAGERKLPIASIMTQRGHAAGRTGMGAVMGSKNLKAVVVTPLKRTHESSPEARAAARRYMAKIKGAARYAELAAHGTSAGINWANAKGMLASYNYSQSQFADAHRIDGTAMAPDVERYRSCQSCPVHCKAEIRLARGPGAGTLADRPDFEPIASWGSKAGLADPDAIIYLHHLCDLAGIDSVSAGNAVAFAIDLYQRGIIDVSDTGGLALHWGDATAMETLVRQMAANQGFGALIGRGVRQAADLIGRGAQRYAYHVKGLELTAYDPRSALGSALGYAVSSRGGDHTSVYARHEATMTPQQALTFYGDERAADRTSPVCKAAMVMRSMTICAVLDSLGLCKIPALSIVDEYDLENEADLVTEVAGLPVTPADLFLAGERILTAERLLNRRFGAEPAHDELPALFLEEPLSDGPSAGSTADLKALVEEFYGLMQWSQTGVPGAVRLHDLGLGDHFRAEDDPRP